MSYQVLARKWRPSNFEQLVGQRQTAQALINALDNQRLHHAYLFTGTRGVGKTTIARILSKSLNCESGISSTPCGNCSSCVEIAQGNFVDLIEIDAASKTKVEDTRELLDNVQYRPTRGRYKVYLIDEVHMLSGHSFNALLKTLEEPPPHVIFLLATTDPQKMPVTVLSRCLQFHLRHMEPAEIVNHLSKILAAEQLTADQEAISAIANAADGSMRDALSLLDQAIVFCGEKIDKAMVLDMLGSIDEAYAFELLAAINKNDAKQLLAVIAQIAEFAPDYEELLADWLSLLHKIAVAQAVGCNETQQDSTRSLAAWATRINPADLQLFYQLSLQAKRDFEFAPHPRQGFEMAMLRILAFKPQSVSAPATSSNSISHQTSDDLKKKTELTGATTQVESLDSNAVISSPVISNSGKSDSKKDDLPQAERSQSASEAKHHQPHPETKSRSQISKNVTTSGSAHSPRLVAEPLISVSGCTPSSNEYLADLTTQFEPLNNANQSIQSAQSGINALAESEPLPTLSGETGEIDYMTSQNIEQDFQVIDFESLTAENWFNVVGGLNISGHGLQVLLNSTAKTENDQLHIFHLENVEVLLTPSARNSIETELRAYFGFANLVIHFAGSIIENESPKQRQARLYEQLIEQSHQHLLADPQMRFLIENLQATLAPESIKVQPEYLQLH